MVMPRQLICVLVMLFCGVASLRAAGYAENRAFSTASSSFQDEIWLRAEMQFAQFSEKYPKSERRPEAILFQAQSLYHLTNAPAAIALLSANFDAAGRLMDEYQYWIAESHYQRGDYTNAATSYRDLLRRFTVSPRRVAALVGE